ncbi:MAG: hypothetical protein ABSB95_05485 [Dissulfurispiraceae bacterium]|jgi:hypothetical protein
MADYISCVEASGGNKQEISEVFSELGSGKTTTGVKGSGSGAIVKGSGSLLLDKASEKAIVKKIETKWYPSGMSECSKVLDKKLVTTVSKEMKSLVKDATSEVTKDIPREVDFGYIELSKELINPIHSDKYNDQMLLFGGEDFEYHIYTNYDLPQVVLEVGGREYPLTGESGIIKIVGLINKPMKAFLVQSKYTNSAAIKIQVKGIARP